MTSIVYGDIFYCSVSYTIASRYLCIKQLDLQFQLQLILSGHYGLVGHLGRIRVTTDFVQERGGVQEAILVTIQKLHNMEEKEIV